MDSPTDESSGPFIVLLRLITEKRKEKNNSLINENSSIIMLTRMKEAKKKMNLRSEFLENARFWVWLAARNHEKSVKIRQLSLFINIRKSMKKKQKSREIATGPLER